MLQDAPLYSLCLLGVRSDDGKSDHVICIVGGWIFDSNIRRALPLSKESLDICCSDGVYNLTDYTSVTRGFMIRKRQATIREVTHEKCDTERLAELMIGLQLGGP